MKKKVIDAEGWEKHKEERERQIEEMAKRLKKTFLPPSDAEILADVLYMIGYRKSTDVAREIFEEIDKLIYRLLNDVHYIAGDLVWDINELKKKYEREGEQ